MLTVGQLRKAIEDFDDDTPVGTACDDATGYVSKAKNVVLLRDGGLVVLVINTSSSATTFGDDEHGDVFEDLSP